MNTFDQEIMARTAMGEARGEGREAMIAVMWSGFNRFTAKRWFSGLTIAGTFLKKSQYSCWLQGDPNYGYLIDIQPTIELFSDALDWAAAVLRGGVPDPTQGATHYANLDECAPLWVEGATKTIQIGKHTFFKNVA